MSIKNDSKVVLTDGNHYTFLELQRLTENPKTVLIGFGVDKVGQIVETILTTPRFVAEEKVLQLQLSTGEKVECSENTLFYLDLTHPIAAKELKVCDKLLVQFGGELEITSVSTLAGLQKTYTLSSMQFGNYLLACGLLVKTD